MSSQTPHPALPREFEHPALQELVLRGRTHGTVSAEELRTACEQADVQDPKRLKAVMRGLGTAGIGVQQPAAAPAPARAVAATSAKARTSTKAVVARDESEVEPAARPAAKKTTAKAAAGTAKATAKPAAKSTGPKAAGKATAAKAATPGKTDDEEIEELSLIHI